MFPRFLLPALVLLSASPLLAQGGAPSRPVLQALDKNGDGTLSADEIQRATDSLLKLDRNQDGKLSPDELGVSVRTPSAPQGNQDAPNSEESSQDPLITAIDIDHDGTLTAAELASAPGALKTLDTNGDGILQPDELRPRQSTPGERATHLLDECDINKDGVLSNGETPVRLRRQFSAIDTNHDGRLDREELTTFYATQTQPGRGNAPQNDASTAQRLPAPADRDVRPAQPK